MRTYVASSWRNDFQPEVVAALRRAGHQVYDFKNPGPGKTGFNWREIDPDWQAWTPEAYRKALEHPVAQAGFDSDMNALKACEACVYVLPCGRSASLELGWAAGAGKFTVVLLAPGEPELMVKMCDRICLTLDEVVREMDLEERRVAGLDLECGGGIVPHLRKMLRDEQMRSDLLRARLDHCNSNDPAVTAARVQRAMEMCKLAGVDPLRDRVGRMSAPLRTLAALRTPEGPSILAKAWAEGDSGLFRWYEESLRTFLDGTPSVATRKYYSDSLRSFLEFVSRSRAPRGQRPHLVAPHDIQESDVIAYQRQLEKGGWIPSPELLVDEAEARVALAVEEMFVSSGARSTLPQVAQKLASQGLSVESQALSKVLGRLARKGSVTRRPRWKDPVYEDGSGKRRRRKACDTVPVDALKYGPAEPSKPASSGTIHSRLIAVSSFFSKIMEPKNIRGVDPPVRFNPATRPLRDSKRTYQSEARDKTIAGKAGIEDLRLLRELIDTLPGTSPLVRARDRLMIEIFSTMGLRVSELVGAKRADLAWVDEAGSRYLVLGILRKGNKKARLRMPEAAEQALKAYDELIEKSDRKPDWKALALSAEAPVVHAIGRWGFASTAVEARVEEEKEARFRTRKGHGVTNPALYPMTSEGVREVFRRYTERAVELRSPEEKARIPDEVAKKALAKHLHPHGLRHLYTQILLDSGVQPRIVAAELGHVDDRTVMRVYAPPVDTARLDFGPMVAAAVGGHPVAQSAPRMAPERPDTMTSDARAFAQKPVIQAVGAGVGEGPVFPAAPLWAYESVPVPVALADEERLLGEGRLPRNAIGAVNLPQRLVEEMYSVGAYSLLPYKIAMDMASVGSHPPDRVLIPMLCSDPNIDQARACGAKLDATKSEVCTSAEQERIFDLWAAYIARESVTLADLMAEAGMSWLRFKDLEPARGAGETPSAWERRVRSSFVRQHALEDGVLRFMRLRSHIVPTYDLFDLVTRDTLVPNPSSVVRVGGMNARRKKLYEDTVARIRAGESINWSRFCTAFFLCPCST